MQLVGIVFASILFFLILHWWSEGILETSDAVLLAVVFCGLVFGLFAAHTTFQLLLAFIPLAATACYCIYSMKTGSMQAFYKKRCKEYMEAIQLDPQNRAAREYLADNLYNMGNLDQAIAELQVAVNMGGDMPCQYKLSKWLKEQRLRDTSNPVCRWCNTENAHGTRICINCGSNLPCQNAFSRWLVGGKTGKGRYYLIIATGLALITASILLLPSQLAFIPIILFITALAGWSLVTSARS